MKIDPPPLAEPFADAVQQRSAAVFGMWVFLATEVLFFGGPLTGYAVDRASYGAAFAAASNRLDLVLGTANTAVLLLSSLLMVGAVEAARRGLGGKAARLLAATAGLGLVFLAVKGYEWHAVVREGLWPGSGFASSGEAAYPERLFLALYFVLTGLHAVHVAVGIAAVGLFALACGRGTPFVPTRNQVVLLGLYWHFVDIVWVFLFPLLYLAHRHG